MSVMKMDETFGEVGMLNLSNFDLDLDDDFPSGIFGKCLAADSLISENVSDRVKVNCSQTCSDLEKSPLFKNQISSIDVKNESQNKESNYGTICHGSLLNSPSKKEYINNLPTEIDNLKRPSSQEEEHKKRKLTNDRSFQRKFPGPAGLLPDKPMKGIKDFSILTDKSFKDQNKLEDKNELIIYSQSSASVFLEPAYQKLISDFDLNESTNPLCKYTVEWVKKATMNKALQGRKIPFLAGVLHYTNHSTPDPVLVLRDPTGEINGTLHRDVWADMGGKLKTGVALALKQVGVLITGVIRRQIYLNITINNILALYSPSEDGTRVEIKTVNKISKEELLQSLEDWRAQVILNKTKRNSSTRLFSTVGDSKMSVLAHPEQLLNLHPTQGVNKFRNDLQNCSKQNVSNEISKSQNCPEEFLSDLGIVLNEYDFSDVMDLPHNNMNVRNEERNDNIRETDPDQKSQLKEEFMFCGLGKSKDSPKQNKSVLRETTIRSSQPLSQAETLMFQEVLSGINLDEFEI